jgi:acid phosphatase
MHCFLSNTGSNPADRNLDAVSPELRALGVGRVMDDISQKMQRKALKKSEDPLKILVNCTHDTTIAGVLQTFGVYDQK